MKIPKNYHDLNENHIEIWIFEKEKLVNITWKISKFQETLM
jgi:hypothetical protein